MQTAAWCSGEGAGLARLSVLSTSMSNITVLPSTMSIWVPAQSPTTVFCLIPTLPPSFSCPHYRPLQIFSLNLPLNLPQGTFSFSWQLVIKPLDKVSSADLCEGHSGEINCAEDEERLQEETLALAKDTGTLGTAPPLRE